MVPTIKPKMVLLDFTAPGNIVCDTFPCFTTQILHTKSGLPDTKAIKLCPATLQNCQL
jgi:hypothetical protein